MPDLGLVNYTRNAKTKGITDESIIETLRHNNQNDEQIRLIFAEAAKTETPETSPDLTPENSHFLTENNPRIIRTVLRFFFWFFVVLLLIAFFMRDQMPPKEVIRTEVSREPLQEVTTKAPFMVSVNNKNFEIEPLYSYDVVGLVVSQRGSDSILDYFHNLFTDSLNVKDVCIVWGENALSGVYRDMDFKNGSYTCYIHTDSWDAYNKFKLDKISNNHLLSDSPKIQNMLSSVRPGDQIRIKGYLSEYHWDNWSRGTSITRTDIGNGACETIYVSDTQFIHQPNLLWKNVFTFSTYAILIIILLRIYLYFVLVHKRVQKAKRNENYDPV